VAAHVKILRRPGVSFEACPSNGPSRSTLSMPTSMRPNCVSVSIPCEKLVLLVGRRDGPTPSATHVSCGNVNVITRGPALIGSRARRLGSPGWEKWGAPPVDAQLQGLRLGDSANRPQPLSLQVDNERILAVGGEIVMNGDAARS